MISLSKSPGYPYVFINSPISEPLLKAIDLETSFVLQNIDRILKYQKEQGKDGEWDGRIHLLKKSKNGHYYFPIGLLSRVLGVMEWFEEVPEIELKFTSLEEKFEWEWCGPELRDYQIDSVIDAVNAERCIIKLPTGSGKTLLGIRIISYLGLPTLILVHKKEILTQWRNGIRKYLNVEPTVFDDKHKEFGNITIAMIQSLHNHLKKNKMPEFDVTIADEVHHMSAKTYYFVAMKSDSRFRFGLSATTNREDGLDMYLEAASGQTHESVTASDLIERKDLALPLFEFIELPQSATIRAYGDFSTAYKNAIVLNPDRNNLIALRAKQLAGEGRQTYIHVEMINHGKILSNLIKAPFVYSQSKDRDATIERFRKGEIKIIISTLLGEGVDIPQIGAIIMAGGRKTKIGTIQKVGRALRPGGTGDAIIVDFVDRGKFVGKHTIDRYNSYVEFFGSYVEGFRK